jgi:glycosyltransferase involved in cell wall biosynthesis
VTTETPGSIVTPTNARRAGVTVVIPTFNEQINVPHALRSVVDWADQVFLVDSESTDRTREIAESMGARVVVQKWLGYAKQKNWAIDTLPIETHWVFILDADESVTPELRDEMLAIAAKDPATVVQSGFYVNRLTYFLSRPIRHGGFFPSYNLRLFKHGRARYEDREVHEHMIVDGPTDRLRGMMLHEDRRGLEHFIAKHNRYSTLEARELWKGRGTGRGQHAEELELGIAFRRWLKYTVQPKLPFVGVWRFLYMYVLRLGLLDGVTGFRFCLLLSIYDTFIGLKLAEIRALQRENQADPAAAVRSVRGLARPEGELVAVKVPRPSAEKDRSVGAPAPPAPAPVPPVAHPPTSRKPRERGPHAVRPSHGVPEDGVRSFAREDAPRSASPPVSVILLTYNEEDNIRACLESCAWCDDVHVLDSGSKDRTREIAAEMGAQVHVNAFQSFGQQRNWAIDNIPVKHRWQFQLDADERFTPALVREMDARIKGAESIDGVCAYRCPSMMMFMDHWLRHAADYPVYQVRLIDRERCRFEDYGHGQREAPTGPVGVLDMPYMHYNFSKGLEEWFDKHNRYSSLEARQALGEHAPRVGELAKGLLSSDPLVRRRTLKQLGYRLPLRSTMFGLYTMVVRLGVLDGVAGINYVRMRAIYESMMSVKLSVLRHKRKTGQEGNGC